MKKYNISQIFLHLIFLFLSLCFILPLILLFSLSISSEDSILTYGYRLIPNEISFESYDFLFKNPSRLTSLISFTAIQALITTILSLFFISLAAYALSYKDYKYKKIILSIIFLAYFLKWGFVAIFYINVRVLSLYDSIFVYIVPNLIDIYFLLILKSCYEKISKNIINLARSDGANEIILFFKVALPISTPILISIGILIFIGRWNDWFTSMLYIDNNNLYTLQYYLQRIIMEEEYINNFIRISTGSGLNPSNTGLISLKFSITILTTLPLLFLAPIFKKATQHCNFSI